MSYEYDSEPFGKERDAAIKKLASEAGVEVTVCISHTLYDLDKWVSLPVCALLRRASSTSLSLSVLCRIIELNGGQSPLTYKRFQTLISRMDPVEVPAESITAEIMGKCTTPLSDDHDDKYGVPSLEELGEWKQKSGLKQCLSPPGDETKEYTKISWIFDSIIEVESVSDEGENNGLMFSAGFDTEGLSSAVWPGGETEALTRLERHLERKVSKSRHKPEECEEIRNVCRKIVPHKLALSQILHFSLGLAPFCIFAVKNDLM